MFLWIQRRTSRSVASGALSLCTSATIGADSQKGRKGIRNIGLLQQNDIASELRDSDGGTVIRVRWCSAILFVLAIL